MRSAFHDIWNSDGIASEKGLTVTEILDAVHDGEIKSMYILERIRQCLILMLLMRGCVAKLDHLVVQDIFLTETANYADVILPASAWAEKLEP